MSSLRTLALLALIAAVSSTQTSDCSYLGLLSHLNLTTTNGVLATMRPVKNWTTPTVVNLGLLLYGILDVDEKSQTVTSHIWIQMHWKNEFLTWNSSDFCGINVLSVSRSMLWIPDVVIREDASDSGSIQDSPLVSVFPSGLVLANRRQRLTSTCQLNLFLFPFDTQICNISFSSMTYNEQSLILAVGSREINFTAISEQFMITQGEWQLKNIKIIQYRVTSEGASYSKLAYRVKIVRKPMLYVINFIIPLFYFLVLDLASFFISEARGEKLGFKVTILLSISVLLLILQDMLPSTEDELPMMASYCVGIFALVGISVLEAMLVSFLMELDGYCGKKAQSSVNTQVEIQLEARNHKEPTEEKGQVNPGKSPLPVEWPGDHNLLRLILEEVTAARQEAGRQDKDQKKAERYRRLARNIDSVFFILYFLTVVTFLVSMYIEGIQNYIENEQL
ncbi:5-hydroxytryptamine receptor 3A-like [Toxotes jaculatrix]|uniref:5-hydroxytryptamine receptor 3A-like n=1 Tax=Toxotes jaculatrix TaxID=941984 RepID=UPI001B3AF692|nr:5-hydroxytryptamine receptor 3A-like [Toxotes jaculatrix]